MVLFIKHIDIEGPDLLGEYFKKQGLKTRTIELHNGEALPDKSDGLSAVIGLGGPMNVYEENKYPWLKDEDRFIRQIILNEIPFIGICLGSQILAKACGAKISKSPEKEIGFYPVRIKNEGLEDPLFEGLEEQLDVFHWHEDMSELPDGATLLASSEGCPHQAFKIGPCAYGLQFHMEVTEPSVHKWAQTYLSKNPSFVQQKNKIIDDYRKKQTMFYKIADRISSNFLKIVNNRNIQKV